MPTQKSKRNKRSRSSCPNGWTHAGYSVPIHLTVKQQRYCRRAIGINRFVYNLCVATHRFCRANPPTLAILAGSLQSLQRL